MWTASWSVGGRLSNGIAFSISVRHALFNRKETEFPPRHFWLVVILPKGIYDGTEIPRTRRSGKWSRARNFERKL
jgi:hypothetical protein